LLYGVCSIRGKVTKKIEVINNGKLGYWDFLVKCFQFITICWY